MLLAGVLLILTACHSEYLSLYYKVHHGAQWNPDHSKIAFVVSKTAYRSAAGVSKFPDGGKPDYLMSEVALYIFDPEIQSLREMINFNDLASQIRTSRSSWDNEILYTDSLLLFRIQPTSGWNLYFKQAKSKVDSSDLFRLRDKYDHAYAINIHTKSLKVMDTVTYKSVLQNRKASFKADLSDLNARLEKVPLQEWGFVLKQIYPKSDEEYITETIYLHNNSAMTRRAVVEQIISKQNGEKIKALLQEMDAYHDELEGLKQKEYEIYSRDTYERIKALLIHN